MMGPSCTIQPDQIGWNDEAFDYPISQHQLNSDILGKRSLHHGSWCQGRFSQNNHSANLEYGLGQSSDSPDVNSNVRVPSRKTPRRASTTTDSRLTRKQKRPMPSSKQKSLVNSRQLHSSGMQPHDAFSASPPHSKHYETAIMDKSQRTLRSSDRTLPLPPPVKKQRRLTVESKPLEEVAVLDRHLAIIRWKAAALIMMIVVLALASGILACVTPAWWFGVAQFSLAGAAIASAISFQLLSRRALRAHAVVIPMMTLLEFCLALGVLVEHSWPLKDMEAIALACAASALGCYCMLTFFAVAAAKLLYRRRELINLLELLCDPSETITVPVTSV